MIIWELREKDPNFVFIRGRIPGSLTGGDIKVLFSTGKNKYLVVTYKLDSISTRMFRERKMAEEFFNKEK